MTEVQDTATPDPMEQAVETGRLWIDTPLCDIPLDAKGINGEDIWAGIKLATDKDRDYFIALQKQNVKKNGKPRNLYIVALGEYSFIVRELNQGDYRAISMECAKQERELMDLLRQTDPQAVLSPDEVNYIEYVATCARAVVDPVNFDFADDELPYTLLPTLYDRIMVLAGTMSQVVVKKL
jgi:hypothetical protein